MTIDRKKIREFVNAKVKEAREWCDAHPEVCGDLGYASSGSQHAPLMWAVVAFILAYVALYYTKPMFVMVERDSELVLCPGRAAMVSLVVAIIVYVAL